MSTINIFGVVGEDVRAADIIPKIQAAKGKVIEIGIMSIGGDVREGLAIYDALREASANGQEVRTFALGITASIASIIFMAGDVREVSDNAEIMIHNSSVVMGGNKHDLKGAIEVLDDIDSKMIGIYTSRTGLDEDKVSDLLNKETFMSADEAVSKGFATDKTTVLALVAIINKTKKEPVKMATPEEDKQAGLLSVIMAYFKGDVKAESKDDKPKEDEEEKAKSNDEDVEVEEEKESEDAKAEGDDPEKEEVKADHDDEEKKEMKAKIESLESELAETKAKAEGDDEEKKEEEAKASLILSGITDKKVTMHQATKLFKKPLAEVSAHLDGLLANATGRGKTEEPNAGDSSKFDQWKAMKANNNHGDAQSFYKEHSKEIRSEMSKEK
ncbi:MAG: head maturation protease, ClpP-related [Thiotrichaceae bacterium]